MPYFGGCPTRRLAAYFLDGAGDPRFGSGQPAQVKNLLASCGDDTKMFVLPSADHAATLGAVQGSGYATAIVRWLGEHREALKLRRDAA